MSGVDLRAAAGIFLRGMAMGVADLIPGVSGGTVALVSGIYDRLVNAIAAFGVPALRLLLTGQWRALWRHVDGGFLLLLISGIGSSVLLLAGMLGHLLDTSPHLVWALFLGLIAASLLHMARVVRRWGALSAVMLLSGAVAAWWITGQAALDTEVSAPWVLLAGMLAICAWILPGISGSFVLVVLGMYEPVLGAIRGFELGILAVFALGCGSGLLLFTHLLRWLLAHHHDTVMALLTGVVLGSLPLLWPWQSVEHGLERVLLTPAGYLAATGREPQWLACLSLMMAGFLSVLALELYSRSRAK
jgi:putative membrane protein